MDFRLRQTKKVQSHPVLTDESPDPYNNISCHACFCSGPLRQIIDPSVFYVVAVNHRKLDDLIQVQYKIDRQHRELPHERA